MDKAHISDIAYRYNFIHAKLSACIILLSSKHRFCKLQVLIQFFLAPDKKLLSKKHRVYDPAEEPVQSDTLNCVHLFFSAYSKACYIGETL